MADENGTQPRRRGRRPITDPTHLSPSRRSVLTMVGEHEGEVLSKRDMAKALDIDVHTVDMSVTELRRRNLLTVTLRYSENGAQQPSVYHVTDLARETYPNLFAAGASEEVPEEAPKETPEESTEMLSTCS